MIESSEYLKEVREQYENYPYPQRDPKDEKQRLLETDLTKFEAINSYCYKGKKQFNDFRILVAGCGTGDAVIHCAEVLKNTKSEIVALDMTKTSLDIAKERAEVRSLKNITWVHDSILEIPNLDLGKFDYVNCCGVLHHLEDPDLGLSVLSSVLKDDGCMGIMLYAKYGRTGIYQMQDLMRRINSSEENLQTKVDNTKLALNALPKTNWFKHSEEYFSDIKKYGDIGVYDLFLHSQDRAYSVPELYEFVEKAGLNFVSFADPAGKQLLKAKNIIQDPILLEKINKLALREQQAIAEILIGVLSKHTFYVSKQKDTIAQVDDLKNIPFLTSVEKSRHLQIAKTLENAPEHANLQLKEKYAQFVFKQTKHSRFIFKYLDGQNNLEEILTKVNQDLDYKIHKDDFIAEFKEIYDIFETVDAMFLITSQGL